MGSRAISKMSNNSQNEILRQMSSLGISCDYVKRSEIPIQITHKVAKDSLATHRLLLDKQMGTYTELGDAAPEVILSGDPAREDGEVDPEDKILVISCGPQCFDTTVMFLKN